MFGEFAVPFRYGTDNTYDSDLEDTYDSDSNSGYKKIKTDKECIGKVWEREVDEEMEQMGLSNQTKKKASGEKRKALN